MVRLSKGLLLATLAAGPLSAQSPTDRMFPDPSTCYARTYSADHLAKHPQQRVTEMQLVQDTQAEGPFLSLWLRVSLRGPQGGQAEALASCENTSSVLYCTMEGDAGGFQAEEAKNGNVLVSVSSLGMGFETDRGFVTLERNAGDDRSFILRPRACR
jgi:hypothetical protein